MKELIKSLGIITVLIGVIVLVFSLIKNVNTNLWLGISGILIAIGLFAHIILNRHVV